MSRPVSDLKKIYRTKALQN